MEDLDAVAGEYFVDSEVQPATAIENNLILPWYAQRIVKRFGRCDALLELGLGHGFTPGILTGACDRHVIVEGSPAVIDLFKRNYPESPVDIVHSFFETFEPRETFDVIVMGFVLEHVDDPELIVKRYKRFLRPNGRLFIAVPNAKSLNRRLGLALGKIDDIYALNENDIALGHKRQFCRETLSGLIVQSGYRIVSEEGVYLKPLPLSVLQTLDDVQGNLHAMLEVGVDFPDLCVALLTEAVVA
jgi:SAM-dependent methyltransferase